MPHIICVFWMVIWSVFNLRQHSDDQPLNLLYQSRNWIRIRLWIHHVTQRVNWQQFHQKSQFSQKIKQIYEKGFFVEASMAGIIYRIRNVISTVLTKLDMSPKLSPINWWPCCVSKNISNQFWSVDWSIGDGWSAPGKIVACLIWADRVSNGGGIDITVL